MSACETLAEKRCAFIAEKQQYYRARISLLQAYAITGSEEFMEEGRRQLAVLELFNGCQPDYHLFETAIRH